MGIVGMFSEALSQFLERNKILGDLVCSETPDRIDVLRGLLRANRFDLTGNEMSALAKRITKCPVSKSHGKIQI